MHRIRSKKLIQFLDALSHELSRIAWELKKQANNGGLSSIEDLPGGVEATRTIREFVDQDREAVPAVSAGNKKLVHFFDEWKELRLKIEHMAFDVGSSFDEISAIREKLSSGCQCERDDLSKRILQEARRLKDVAQLAGSYKERMEKILKEKGKK